MRTIKLLQNEQSLRAGIVLYQTLRGAKTSAEKGKPCRGCVISQHLPVKINIAPKLHVTVIHYLN